MRQKEVYVNRGVAGYACPMAVPLDVVTQARYQAQRLASGPPIRKQSVSSNNFVFLSMLKKHICCTVLWLHSGTFYFSFHCCNSFNFCFFCCEKQTLKESYGGRTPAGRYKYTGRGRGWGKESTCSPPLPNRNFAAIFLRIHQF